ncbi:uncharacterized protein LOC116708024 isoform X2 [Xiphophorus hellerii]|uniref:uncharacterized protein LOC116708024 isoform X2 n=1 Tax=Xiphophorus hellerii TaxID=8084 RepID=UPI0013B4358F|nr:uncharacterized protein LOC116708024 isoform X2 [Xiphophorus hellerii]
MATGSGWSAVVSSSSTAVINYPHQRSLLKELTASPASPECLPVTVIPLTLWTRGPEPGSFPGFRTSLVTPWKIPTGRPSSQTHLSVVFASISWTPRLAVEPLRCVPVAPEPTCPFSAALLRLFLDPLRDRDPGHTQLPSKIQIQPPPMNHCCPLQLIPWTRPPSHTLIIVYLNKSL